MNVVELVVMAAAGVVVVAVIAFAVWTCVKPLPPCRPLPPREPESQDDSWCPHCHEPWEEVSRRVIERERCYGLVRRRSRSRSDGRIGGPWTGPGLAGWPVVGWGENEWKERVPVVRTTYEVTYACRFCGETWSEKETVRREDFTRP